MEHNVNSYQSNISLTIFTMLAQSNMVNKSSIQSRAIILQLSVSQTLQPPIELPHQGII